MTSLAGTLHPRAYRSDDLAKVLQFVGECNALADFCGCIHPGDVVHFISNTLRGRNVEQHLFLWENSHEQILALTSLYPARFGGYDLLVHPHHRGGEREQACIAWSEQAQWELMQRSGSDNTWVGSDVMDCDEDRARLLHSRGYAPTAELYMCYTTRSLRTLIPASGLPDGFTIRPVEGEQDAERLCAVHSGAFGSKWLPDEYVNVMRTPGFHRDRELVVVAPDGRFAAFLIYWLDPISKSGLFEPVGCHRDFQRRGLTKALMLEGLRCMAAHGMDIAIVKHFAGNEAASSLYRSVGFTIKYRIADFRKVMSGSEPSHASAGQ
jgi:ribosomal protein S18 acetylase RimI-like enzyme